VLRGWVLAHPVREVLVVTSPIHSRRARWTLRIALDGTGARVHVTSCDSPFSPASLWWLEERPLIQVLNETAKLALYAFRYFLPAAVSLGGPPPPLAAPATPQPS
jgi:uncharacterized SAM-binding protein YcdF (DUF218 family)